MEGVFDLISKMSVEDLMEAIKKGDLKASEVVEHFKIRSEKMNETLKAYISKCEIKKGEGPLSGIPFAVKDNMQLEGTKTTCASKILENYGSTYTATAVEKLLKNGAVVLGKTNLDEFAMGSSTEYSAFFSTKNPWDLERVPGGSSGGSAAAVAGGMVPFALGSDTGGSIRQPASFCGIVGYKPSYGLVSRYGLAAFASSMDQIGPLTKNVRDAALITSFIVGRDEKDATTVEKKMEFLEKIEESVEGMKMAIPKEFVKGLNPKVRAVFNEAMRNFEKLGVQMQEVSIPSLKYSVAVYYVIAPAEASSNLSRYDGIRYGLRVDNETIDGIYNETRDQGFGKEVKRRIMLGTFTLSATYYDAYFDKAQRVRAMIKEEMNKIFSSYDAILGPTTPSVAFKHGEISNPLDYYLQDIYTIPANLVGSPAISVPMGFVDEMPIGLQIIGRRFDDAKVLQIARNYEKVRGEFPMPSGDER